LVVFRLETCQSDVIGSDESEERTGERLERVEALALLHEIEPRELQSPELLRHIMV
jgi:hypothetical protein